MDGGLVEICADEEHSRKGDDSKARRRLADFGSALCGRGGLWISPGGHDVAALAQRRQHVA